ncbi:MAG: F0F1 ATP synthase subunit epsilon [Endozoicomonadaceae bacterium]|nr:F0F1 ATP synthase subunit epsilon [Endozoicomonadaceae bacterium]MBE8233192.1 F0F1 ATP synthase subunit epsilon [Endozoicomonadaceae bacterium]
MMPSFKCYIVSFEEILFSGELAWLSVIGTQGEIGIYPGHTPLLTEICPGPAHLKTTDHEEKIFYLSGGYLEILPREVKILADTALRADDIDERRAEEARHAAEKQLLSKQDQVNYAQVATELAEAAALLHTIRRKNRMKKF